MKYYVRLYQAPQPVCENELFFYIPSEALRFDVRLIPVHKVCGVCLGSGGG